MTSYDRDLIRVARAEPTDRPPQERLGRAANAEVILVAEDDDACRRLVVRILEHDGYNVLQARNGREAISVSAMYPGPIHLLLSDVLMPGANGPQVAESLGQQRPAMKVLFMSGYSAEVLERRGVRGRSSLVLAKPFKTESLRRRVRALLAAAPGESRVI